MKCIRTQRNRHVSYIVLVSFLFSLDVTRLWRYCCSSELLKSITQCQFDNRERCLYAGFRRRQLNLPYVKSSLIKQESRAIAGRTARCRCSFRCVSIIEFYNKSIMERLCTLNLHDTLVDTDASGAKDSTKHLESRLEVIQGHAFWDHWRRGTAYYCIITWAIDSEISKERFEHIRFREPHCHSADTVYRTLANIRTSLMFIETRIIDLHFAPDSIGLSSFTFFLVGSIKRFCRKSAFRPFKVIQGHWFSYQSKARMRLSISVS